MCLRIWACNFFNSIVLSMFYVTYFYCFRFATNFIFFVSASKNFRGIVAVYRTVLASSFDLRYYDYLLRMFGILCKICLGPQPFRMHWVNLRWSSWPSLAFWGILGTSSAQEGIWTASGFSPGFSYCDCQCFPPGTRPATRLPPFWHGVDAFESR